MESLVPAAAYPSLLATPSPGICVKTKTDGGDILYKFMQTQRNSFTSSHHRTRTRGHDRKGRLLQSVAGADVYRSAEERDGQVRRELLGRGRRS